MKNSKRLAIALITLTCGCVVVPSAIAPDEEETLRRRAIEALKAAVRYKHAGSIRAAGIEMLQRHLGTDGLSWIRAALHDEVTGVRVAAVFALGALGDTQSHSSLLALADDDDPSIRIAACYALHRLGDTSFVAGLPELLLEHPSPVVRQDAAYCLGLLGEHGAIKVLARAMKDDDEMVRQQALESMALLGNQEAIEQLTFSASSGMGGQRVSAINTLGDLKIASLAKTFRYKLQTGEYRDTRLAAARALGKLDIGEGLAIALQSLNFNSPQQGVPDDSPGQQIMRIRVAAATALGAIGDRRALGPLRRRLEDPSDPRTQIAAADAILEILGGRTMPLRVLQARRGAGSAGGGL